MMTPGAFFWDYSVMGIQGIDSIHVLWGKHSIFEITEKYSVHFAPEKRMNRMQFAKNKRNCVRLENKILSILLFVNHNKNNQLFQKNTLSIL